MNLSPTQSEQLAKSLINRIDGDVFVDFYRRALYSTDASPYQIQPLAVVVPRAARDVVVAMQAAAEQGVPLGARGSGTSLSGQSIGPGLILDFSQYMNRILHIDPAARTARIEPGVVLDQLNAAAAPHGLQFGPDVATSSRANLGGMIGNNSAGARSIRHGKTVDHVIELEVVLADGTQARLAPCTPQQLRERQAQPGLLDEAYRAVERIVAANRDEIVARYPRVLRRVSGYNLDEFVPECRQWIPTPLSVVQMRAAEAQRYPGANFNLAKLIVGAEGTLACVTEALVHLVPLPKQRAVVVLHFDSMTASVASIGAVLACQPSAAELLDGEIIRLAEQSLEYRHYLDFVVGQPESLMLVEFSGETADEVRGGVERLLAAVKDAPGLFHVLPAFDPQMVNHIWACRKAGLPLLMGIPGLRKPIAFVEDAAVDPSRLPQFVARFHQLLRDEGTDGAFYGHASVGCLHIRPMLDLSNRDDLERLRRISRAVCELVLEFGGSMSGEHGDGLARSYLNERLFGSQLFGAFKQVKAAFDPAGILNPGKIVNGQEPTQNLRQGAEYRTLPMLTTLDFSREGGIARAAEMCNGAGVCRKLQTGTMCPSFMATGEEEHSTRGRANALRLVLSGALPPEELTGQRLFQTFDLCLQCKGCKAECPSNVDVAKLKAEFLSHYYAANGTPPGVRLMADVARLNRWGAALAPLSNLAARLPGARWLAQQRFGIDRRRPLPQFHRQHFRSWFDKHSAVLNAPRGPIVLLDDCLTSYCEPRVNRAAVKVLEAAGYEVHLAGLTCCGRAHISKGLLTESQQLARENITRLLPWANRGVPIVGCEPSCLLTLTDEYLDLAPGPAARQVAAAAALIDTHLIRAGIELPLRPVQQPIMLHGHCHQKALVGARDTQSLLRQTTDQPVTLVDSGCCGMAGSFGYEHYDLSMRIGERVLFPAVRQATESIVAAPGFSCRQQIEHGTGRPAKHPIEILADGLLSERSSR